MALLDFHPAQSQGPSDPASLHQSITQQETLNSARSTKDHCQRRMTDSHGCLYSKFKFLDIGGHSPHKSNGHQCTGRSVSTPKFTVKSLQLLLLHNGIRSSICRKLNAPPDTLILELTLKLSHLLHLPNERRTTKQLPQLFSENWYKGDIHSFETRIFLVFFFF